MRRLCYCDVEIPLLLPKAALLAYQSQVRGEKKREGGREVAGARGGERERGSKGGIGREKTRTRVCMRRSYYCRYSGALLAHLSQVRRERVTVASAADTEIPSMHACTLTHTSWALGMCRRCTESGQRKRWRVPISILGPVCGEPRGVVGSLMWRNCCVA